MNNKNKIVVITGPSGAGKTSLVELLLRERSGEVKKVITTVTRERRNGEENGVHYHFVTPEEFHKGIKGNLFLEHEEVFPGKFYGVGKDEILRHLNKDYLPILIMDIHGALKLRNQISRDGIDYEFLRTHAINFEFICIYADEEELMSRIISDNQNGSRSDTTMELEERYRRIQTELLFVEGFTDDEKIYNAGDLSIVANEFMNRVLYSV